MKTARKRYSTSKPGKKGFRGQIIGFLLVILAGAFVGGGIFFGFIFLTRLTDIVGTVSQTYLELPINVGGKKENAPDWKAKERINVLLLGIDQRPDEVGAPTRTDTIMVVTLDPNTNSAGILSIPRDLWVTIPVKNGNVLEDRINTANVYGDLYKYPGGGIALAKATVENLLKIKIHYYALINFEGFEKIVDTLGGITVKLDQALDDRAYPTPNYGYVRVYIPAGVQTLNGQKALWYARSRNQWGDFERMKHQQQVLFAIRDKALQLDVLPKLPELWKQFKDTIKTDLSVPEMLTLAKLGKDVEQERIVSRSIDITMANPGFTDAGADVLFPNKAKIADLVQEIFFDSKLATEGAQVEVLNGTSIPGLAARTAAYLQSQGFKQVTYSSADDGLEHQETVIQDYSHKSYSARLIADLLDLPQKRIEQKNGTDSVDIRIILGKDIKIPEK